MFFLILLFNLNINISEIWLFERVNWFIYFILFLWEIVIYSIILYYIILYYIEYVFMKDLWIHKCF